MKEKNLVCTMTKHENNELIFLQIFDGSIRDTQSHSLQFIIGNSPPSRKQ